MCFLTQTNCPFPSVCCWSRPLETATNSRYQAGMLKPSWTGSSHRAAMLRYPSNQHVLFCRTSREYHVTTFSPGCQNEDWVGSYLHSTSFNYLNRWNCKCIHCCHCVQLVYFCIKLVLLWNFEYCWPKWAIVSKTWQLGCCYWTLYNIHRAVYTCTD